MKLYLQNTNNTPSKLFTQVCLFNCTQRGNHFSYNITMLKPYSIAEKILSKDSKYIIPIIITENSSWLFNRKRSSPNYPKQPLECPLPPNPSPILKLLSVAQKLCLCRHMGLFGLKKFPFCFWPLAIDLQFYSLPPPVHTLSDEQLSVWSLVQQMTEPESVLGQVVLELVLFVHLEWRAGSSPPVSVSVSSIF